ncbi:unnamed protein product [Boreogadus saida]
MQSSIVILVLAEKPLRCCGYVYVYSSSTRPYSLGLLLEGVLEVLAGGTTGTMGNVVHPDPVALFPTTAVHREVVVFFASAGQCRVRSPEFFQQWRSLLNIPWEGSHG